MIARDLSQGRKVVLAFDEVISSGRTLFAFMEFLINRFGDGVVDLVDFRVPNFRIDYVPVGERMDFTLENVNVANMEHPFPETMYKHVWRAIISTTGDRTQSFGLGRKES